MADTPTRNRRALYRVTVVGSAIHAHIGPLADCQLYDASPDGFATLISAESFTIGAIVQVTLHYQACRYSGRAEVCSHVSCGPASHRYGLRALDGQLRAGLRALAVNEERIRLRRHAERRAP